MAAKGCITVGLENSNYYVYNDLADEIAAPLLKAGAEHRTGLTSLSVRGRVQLTGPVPRSHRESVLAAASQGVGASGYAVAELTGYRYWC